MKIILSVMIYIILCPLQYSAKIIAIIYVTSVMNECREAAYYTSNFTLVGLPADCWLEINATIYTIMYVICD